MLIHISLTYVYVKQNVIVTTFWYGIYFMLGELDFEIHFSPSKLCRANVAPTLAFNQTTLNFLAPN